MIKNIFKFRKYILNNAFSQIHYRYAGTVLGVFWNFLNPIIETLLYIVVFQGLLAFRSPNRESNYALFLIAGLFPWFAFSELISEASKSLTKNHSALRTLSVPQEIYITIELVISTFTLFVYFLIIFIVYFIFGQPPTITWLLLPVLGILLMLLAFAIGLGLANVRIFFTDIGEFIRHLIHLWRWTLPIIYSAEIFPQWLQDIIKFNPPYYFIESIRNVILNNETPNTNAWIIMLGWVIVFFVLGGVINKKLEGEVRDNL